MFVFHLFVLIGLFIYGHFVKKKLSLYIVAEIVFCRERGKKRKNWEKVRNSGKMGGPNIKGSKMGKIEKIRSSSALPFFKSTLQTKYFGGLT